MPVMLTDQKRLDGYRKALEKATRDFGVICVSTYSAEQLGAAVLIKPGAVNMQLVANWQPAQEAEKTNARNNGTDPTDIGIPDTRNAPGL